MSTEKCMPSIVLYGAVLDPAFYSLLPSSKGSKVTQRQNAKITHSIFHEHSQKSILVVPLPLVNLNVFGSVQKLR